MRPRVLPALAIVSALWAPIAAGAQEVADETLPLDAGEIDDRDFPELTVDVTLPTGISPSDIDPSMFTVVEAGQVVSSEVEALASGSLDVILAIDTSGSMGGDALEAAKRSALAFIDQLGASARIAVVGFGAEPTVVVPLTDDRDQLNQALTDLVAAGETALYDALIATIGQLDNDGDARTALVVLSDGGDTTSSTSLSIAAEQTAARFDVVHAVSLPTAEQDLAALRQIVSGGGAVAEAVDLAALESIYTDIADRITNQYRLRWVSELETDSQVQVELDTGDQVHRAIREVGVPAPSVDAGTVEVPATTSETGSPQSALPPAIVESPKTVSSSVLWFGVGFLTLALFALGLVVFGPREHTRNLAQEVRGRLPRQRDLSGFARRAVGAVDSVLRRHPEQRMGVALRLEQAGLDWSPGEAGVLAIASAAILALFGFGLLAILGLLLFPAVGLAAGLIWLSSRITKRRELFTAQLDNTLQLIAGSLRSGFGVNQALGTVADESEWPTSEEFTRIQGEVRLGRDLEAALEDSARRIDSEDYYWVVRAIEISRAVGGNLAEVLDNISGTIRQRNRLRRQVRSLSAEGRLSAVILFLLPIVLFGWMQVTNSEYVNLLLDRRGGQIALVAAAFLMVVGGFWLKQITRIRF